MRKASKVLKVVAINAVVLFALLLITEYSFQYFNLFPQAGLKTYSYERYLALKEFVPNNEVNEYAAQVKCLELTNFKALNEYKADSNGLFTSGQSHSNGVDRILTLGDAQSCDLSLPPPFQLHQLLAQKLNSNYEILNASFPGSDLIHATNKFMNVLMPMRPEKVIISYNLSDLLRLQKDGNYWGGIYGDKKKLRVWQANSQFNTNSQASISDSLLLIHFEKAYSNLINLLKAWHVEPILVCQALNYSDTLALEQLINHHSLSITVEELVKAHKRMNERIKHLSKTNKLHFINADSVLSNPSSFKNHLLFNKTGIEKYSQLITDSLNKWDSKPKLINNQ